MFEDIRNSGYGCIKGGKRKRKGLQPASRNEGRFRRLKGNLIKGNLSALSHLIVVVVGIVGVFLLAGCAKDERNPSMQGKDEVDQTIRKFSADHIKNGQRKWLLSSDLARLLKSEKIKTDKPEIRLFRDGKEVMLIVGDSGEIDQRTNDLKVMGNVIATADDMTRIETEELFWSDGDEKILAPGEVKVSKEKSVLLGDHLESDSSLTKVKLKNIKARVYTKPKNGG